MKVKWYRFWVKFWTFQSWKWMIQHDLENMQKQKIWIIENEQGRKRHSSQQVFNYDYLPSPFFCITILLRLSFDVRIFNGKYCKKWWFFNRKRSLLPWRHHFKFRDFCWSELSYQIGGFPWTTQIPFIKKIITWRLLSGTALAYCGGSVRLIFRMWFA